MVPITYILSPLYSLLPLLFLFFPPPVPPSSLSPQGIIAPLAFLLHSISLPSLSHHDTFLFFLLHREHPAHGYILALALLLMNEAISDKNNKK